VNGAAAPRPNAGHGAHDRALAAAGLAADQHPLRALDIDLGFRHLVFHDPGHDQEAFLRLYGEEVLPRLRDFQGVPNDAFDGRGSYALGIKEQTVFPEIDFSKVDKLRGLEVCIVTTAKTDAENTASNPSPKATLKS